MSHNLLSQPEQLLVLSLSQRSMNIIPSPAQRGEGSMHRPSFSQGKPASAGPRAPDVRHEHGSHAEFF